MMSVNAVVSTDASSTEYNNDASPLSAQYITPPPEPQNSSSFTSLKDRIRHHYELASEHYHSLWGEHIHHGYFLHPNDTKEIAQIRLIQLLLDRAQLPQGAEVLDVGCGLGGTARFLARHHDCHVTGLTISAKQVDMATQLSAHEEEEAHQNNNNAAGGGGFITVGEHGSVRFVELDAENMGHYFPTHAVFDCVWISEAMSHLPDKPLFFQNAINVLRPGGKLVVADWFRADDLTPSQLDADIKPIEDGMLLPPLCTPLQYRRFAEAAGLKVFSHSLDISKDVAKTWDITWSLVQSPSLWAFAFSQGRDGIAFLQAFRAMRRGYANGTFRYAVMIFQKPVEQEVIA
ncbi:MAG: hypothetical protein Q9202_006276 [Teloschistes flavicans]